MSQSVDVIIPVYKPDGTLRQILERLHRQTVRPAQILLVNTEKELFDERLAEGLELVRVMHIRKVEFDHGGTRHMAALQTFGDLLLFMTQDAVPEDEFLIQKLLAAFADPRVCAAYARQVPRKDCNVLEKYTRSFNYGPQSRVKTAADLPRLGIKTYFCSNVCAMYRRSAYEELGGFERHTIFNEDMIFAGKLIQAGRAVAYCADARVIHSHNYSGAKQFCRNFDLGVSQAQHPEIFDGIRSESEGLRMVKQSAQYLLKIGKPQMLFALLWQSGCKYLGYRLGKNWEKLPEGLVRSCSMNQAYWDKRH